MLGFEKGICYVTVSDKFCWVFLLITDATELTDQQLLKDMNIEAKRS